MSKRTSENQEGQGYSIGVWCLPRKYSGGKIASLISDVGKTDYSHAED